MLLKAFLVGGAICLIGQLLMDLTSHKVTPGHILVGFVTIGVIISAMGYYQPLVDFAGAGATIPLSGFGHLMAQGAIKEAQNSGVLGVFKGPLSAAAGGVTTAVLFGYLAALLFKPKG